MVGNFPEFGGGCWLETLIVAQAMTVATNGILMGV
jgi:hypothetical protein